MFKPSGPIPSQYRMQSVVVLSCSEDLTLHFLTCENVSHITDELIYTVFSIVMVFAFTRKKKLCSKQIKILFHMLYLLLASFDLK